MQDEKRGIGMIIIPTNGNVQALFSEKRNKARERLNLLAVDKLSTTDIKTQQRRRE